MIVRTGSSLYVLTLSVRPVVALVHRPQAGKKLHSLLATLMKKRQNPLFGHRTLRQRHFPSLQSSSRSQLKKIRPGTRRRFDGPEADCGRSSNQFRYSGKTIFAVLDTNPTKYEVHGRQRRLVEILSEDLYVRTAQQWSIIAAIDPTALRKYRLFLRSLACPVKSQAVSCV